MTRRVAVFALTCLLLGRGETAAAACADPAVTIRAEAMTKVQIRAFDDVLRRAIARVCAWWGPTFDGPYTVDIEDSKGPSMAMIPAWRGHHGTMLFRSARTRNGRSPVVHEVVHIFAPNANRFLAEGLAVYAHEHLGGNPAYPTFGLDLHKAAKPLTAEADLPALDAIVVPKGLRIEDRAEQRKAYTVAGSFVRYLIETRGMDKFRELYAMTPMVPRKRVPSDSARWETVYGASLDTLAESWKAFLAAQ